MPPTRSRSIVLTVAACLSLGLVPAAGPVTAADGPTAAVDELIDAVEAGDFDAVDALVCEAERASVREMLDPAEAMGYDATALMAAITFQVEDRAVELVSEEGDEATVRLTGSMAMDLGGADPEQLARDLLADSLGEDLSDEDIETWLPLVSMSFTQSVPIDQEVTVVIENDTWLVCGGLGQPSDGSNVIEPSVSQEGLCGLVGPEELNGLGDVQYDSSSGFADSCTYSTSDHDTYHYATVSVDFGTDAGYLVQAYGADQELEVAGATAWATTADDYGTNLITQVGDDVLMVSVALPEDAPADLDWLTQAIGVTELFMPLMDEARDLLVGPTPPPTPEPTPEVSLCESLPLDELNELTGLGFDEAEGDSAYCSYVSSDGVPGYHMVTATLIDLPLDDYAAWLPDAQEAEVGELRAATVPGSLLVELPGGTHTLMIGGFLDPADEDLELTIEQLLVLLAERLAPAIEVPASGAGNEADLDLEGLEALIKDADGPLAESDAAALPRAMCEYLDIDAVNALGIIEVDTANSFFHEHCWLSPSDPAAGYVEISALVDGLTIEDVRGWYAEGVDTTVAGMPAFAADDDVRVETSVGGINFNAVLPEAAIAAGHQSMDLLMPVAEMVVAAIEADLSE